MKKNFANSAVKSHKSNASNGTNFIEKAREEALKVQREMESIISLKFALL